jgi:hypothetical protein
LKRVCGRVLAATGISKKTIAGIREEGRDIEKGATFFFSAQGKSRQRKKGINIVAAVDDFDEEVITRHLYNVYFTQK